MKAKDLKIIRKKLAKLNKVDYDPLPGISCEDALSSMVPKALDDEVLSVRLVNARNVTETVFQDLLALFEQNMGELYRNSSWGLDPSAKAAELRHDMARYLLVQTPTNHVVAFMHYRFEYDDDDQPKEVVLYVYEIQVDQRFQRRGLGKALMAISEQIAVQAEVAKVMLTVFTKNHDAMEFYKRLNYEIHSSSPSMHKELADYEILSKSISRPSNSG